MKQGSEVLSLCTSLRRELWVKLFPEVNVGMVGAYEFLEAIGQMDEEAVKAKDRVQVWNDIKRCSHINPPLLEEEAAKKKLYNIIIWFLATNPEVHYIQGMESIAAVLYSEYTDQPYLIPLMLKQLYQRYL